MSRLSELNRGCVPVEFVDGHHAVHWTDAEGVVGILAEGSMSEGGSFSTSLRLPFDINNGCPFGIITRLSALEAFGYHFHDPSDTGCTAKELRWELTPPEDGMGLPMHKICGFVVRTMADAETLRLILTNEYVLMAGKPRPDNRPTLIRLMNRTAIIVAAWPEDTTP